MGRLYDYRSQLAKVRNVLQVQSIFDIDPKLGRADYVRLLSAPRSKLPAPAQQALKGSVGKHIVLFNVLTAKQPTSDDARSVVKAIRQTRHVGDGEVLVTGQTAYDLDLIDFIVGHSALAVGFVLAVTYLVLFFLTGSVLLPLKAVLTNILSISASFGAMVWIFQQGHLSQQLNFTPAAIDPILPVLVFGIVFGLSMDYEVLLLSRIQEEYLRSGDNRLAVAQGLEKSGRLITGAAAIMIGVFCAFATADVVFIKSVGLAMAIAVAIDATIVRALIVPSVMRLLGRLNWWAPPPLARFYRHLRYGGRSELTLRPGQA